MLIEQFPGIPVVFSLGTACTYMNMSRLWLKSICLKPIQIAFP